MPVNRTGGGEFTRGKRLKPVKITRNTNDQPQRLAYFIDLGYLTGKLESPPGKGGSNSFRGKILNLNNLALEHCFTGGGGLVHGH
ncbi:MAG: hypothetical protein A2Y80_04665 [Deltaproteobacteria bacterium RBG_13_58_19]|nr:MAG: hypothetical protein A2Y80_04665 [Deltaproteobacteria bacterium RBG_13_58_19]